MFHQRTSVLKSFLIHFFLLFLITCKWAKFFRTKSLAPFHWKYSRSKNRWGQKGRWVLICTSKQLRSKLAHLVEFSLLFLLMLHDKYFLFRRLISCLQRRSGRIILARKKYGCQHCYINKTLMHCSIELKFTAYILDTMGYTMIKNRPLTLIRLLRYKRSNQEVVWWSDNFDSHCM